MMNKIILGGLALVCMVYLAGSAPVDEYGEILDFIESVINAEKRAENERESEPVNTDKEWHWYKAIDTVSKEDAQPGELQFKEGQSLLLNLDNKDGEDKWVKGYKKVYSFYWSWGQVNTRHVISTDASEKNESEPRFTSG
ncbi:unnamed protein product [Owenia fusiformis]|uniref:Uncharacterized protein n=1 Tax=Owenia fusiformis TaxID=6347 RepID=A0A8S4PUE5_OWEFU|nr:unnamed protein product [Owenia fusiformis]